eukprot:comp12642_c0_seq1/m.7696 comp12642_c0_seq1/g.7696  ORF comp12642_c0_seq1/g.7696 comp12642_c0_seq1/m.7696 type:complete len:485 (-) comp12642_c0_seq1:908-2362(-)
MARGVLSACILFLSETIVLASSVTLLSYAAEAAPSATRSRRSTDLPDFSEDELCADILVTERIGSGHYKEIFKGLLQDPEIITTSVTGIAEDAGTPVVLARIHDGRDPDNPVPEERKNVLLEQAWFSLESYNTPHSTQPIKRCSGDWVVMTLAKGCSLGKRECRPQTWSEWRLYMIDLVRLLDEFSTVAPIPAVHFDFTANQLMMQRTASGCVKATMVDLDSWEEEPARVLCFEPDKPHKFVMFSPEKIRCDATMTHKANVYNMGAILWRLMPFDHPPTGISDSNAPEEDRSQKYAAIVNTYRLTRDRSWLNEEKAKLYPEIPNSCPYPVLCNLIPKMMSYRPEDRPGPREILKTIISDVRASQTSDEGLNVFEEVTNTTTVKVDGLCDPFVGLSPPLWQEPARAKAQRKYKEWTQQLMWKKQVAMLLPFAVFVGLVVAVVAATRIGAGRVLVVRGRQSVVRAAASLSPPRKIYRGPRSSLSRL